MNQTPPIMIYPEGKDKWRIQSNLGPVATIQVLTKILMAMANALVDAPVATGVPLSEN